MSRPIHVVREASEASAMLHPLRQRLLAELAEPDSATGVARRMGLPRQRVNYHVRQLEQQGLLEPVGERRRGNCTERLVQAVARSYFIDPAALGRLAGVPGDVADKTSSAYLVAAAAQVVRDVAELRDKTATTGQPVPTLTLQAQIRFATPATQRAFASELTAAVAQLTAKYHDDTARDGRTFRLLTGSWPVPAPRDARGPA
jgi:DNA-binding transcriptional ArsR family regulator